MPCSLDVTHAMVSDPDRVTLLGDGVPDPIGAGPELYESTAALIEREIELLAGQIANGDRR